MKELKSEQLHCQIKPSLKDQLSEFADENGISQSGAVRLILNKQLKGEGE